MINPIKVNIKSRPKLYRKVYHKEHKLTKNPQKKKFAKIWKRFVLDHVEEAAIIHNSLVGCPMDADNSEIKHGPLAMDLEVNLGP